ASFYKEHNKDDHSVDIDQKFKYDYDVHGHPYPVPVPAHPWKRDPSRSHPPATVIDGPGGINSGNAAANPTKNELGLAYSETNIDDHSVDIDQKTNVDVDNHWDYPVPVPAYPHHPHWPHHLKARQFGNTVIDGPGGVDRGSDAAIPTKNGFAFGYSETNIDDHSVDIDTKTDVDIDTDFHAVPYPVHYHPHPHHFHGRGLGDTVIDGPGGVDSGNGFSAPTDNEFASFYDETNLDDHSFTGKAAADVDIDNHYPYPYPYPVPAHIHHWKARAHSFVPPWKDVTLIDGPGGIDTGNDADLSTTNTFLSDYDEFNQDDHSFTGKSAADVDVDTHVPYPVPVPAPGHPHHWKARGHHEPPVTVIGGPSGIDTGNSADLSSVNTAISDYDEFNRDDHSFDAKAKADYDLHYRRSVHARQFGTDVIDGPGGIDSGNGFSAPTSNHAVAGYSEYNEDDHSVDIDSKTDVDVDGHFHPVPLPHPVPAPHPVPVPHHHEHPGPGPFHESPAAPAPAPVEAPTGEVHVPQEALKPNPAPEPVVQHNPQGEETHQAPPSGEVHAPVPEYNPQPPSPQTESFEPAVHSEPAPPLNVPNTPNTPSDNTESDFSQPIVHSTPEAPAPSVPSVNENSYQPAPPAAHNFESQAAPSTSLVHAAQTQPDPVFHGMAIPSSSVAHVALASTVTVPQASSFAKIPVYVPQSSAVVPAAHGPASSTVVVHPTGVAASTPSSASSSAAIASRADTVFTGGVAHLTPHAGVFSVVCGVVGLLAFVL
ncbi:putative GPI anchored protein, partial [Aspergillus affinis]|uniref:putative GPI anchored protein n=1 Tax=Aspergillus affinis TaxID=1070780 RepID=UPI0022FDFFCE